MTRDRILLAGLLCCAPLALVWLLYRELQWDRCRSFRVAQGPRSGLAAILGQWPGDESDEVIARAMDEPWGDGGRVPEWDR